jgi:mono/diheme cytochrome c family protein
MHRNALLIMLVLINGVSLTLLASSANKSEQEPDSAVIGQGQSVYKKSNCGFCHGWAGDGRGHPRSPGVASNLRESTLEKEVMTYIIRCGVPGGVMPYHDRMAYRDDRCIADAVNLDANVLPQNGKNISAANLDALVNYLMSAVRGSGEVTFEQCEAFYKLGSRNCLYLKAETNQ